MNYFLISTIIFLTFFIIVLILLILIRNKFHARIKELENKNSNLDEKKLLLESVEREYRKLLDIVIDSMQHGIVLLDNSLRAIKINNSISNLFYLDRAKLAGEKTIFIFNNRNLEELIEESLSGDKAIRKDIIFYGDEEISLSVDAIPLNLENYYVMLIFNNTTQEVEFSRLRSQFVANVSHEMRTPLTSIKGYVETLLENRRPEGSLPDSEITIKYLSKTLGEVERLNILIEDVLNLSNIEHRRNVLFKQEYNIVEIIRECIDSLSFLAEKNNVKIEFIFSRDPVLLQTEEALFSQIVRNLVENAIFHGGSGTILKVILEENNSGIVLGFEDNGQGIDSSDLPFIFQRFYKSRSGYSYLKTGSGLGLSIVKHIVELHGGTIEASSQPGIRTRFVMTFQK